MAVIGHSKGKHIVDERVCSSLDATEESPGWNSKRSLKVDPLAFLLSIDPNMELPH